MYRIYSKIMDNLTNVYFIIKSKKNKKINPYRGNIYKLEKIVILQIFNLPCKIIYSKHTIRLLQ